MATNNNRDVRMTLSVETLGAEDIQKLQNTVAALAREGGEAAPEFQRLADEIGRLGEQAAALRAFTDLTAQTAELSARQQQASTNSAELGARLATLSATTLEASERQRAAAAALAEAQAAARATRDELATLIATTDRAGRAEAEYAAEVQRLKLAKIEQRAEIERLGAALAASNAEVRTAEKAEAALARSYERAESSAEKAAAAVRANADAVQEAADAALDLGVTTDNIAAAQAELVQSLNRTGRAAGDLRENVQRLADIERELAGIRAFEKQAEEAARLQRASEYLDFFEQSLRELAETERRLAQQQADERWQREAEAIVDAAHAAQELARQTEVLEAAQRELAAQRAFEQQAEDARRLREAADYVREWEEMLESAERQARETAEASAQASRQIADAFDTLGVRSAESLRAEIQRVREAMATVQNQAGITGGELENAFEAGNERISDLEAQLREVNGEMTTGDKIAALFSNSIGQIAAGNLVADAVGYLIGKVKDLAAAFLSTIVETQKLRAALFAVYGDAQKASQQFDFLRKTAMNAGVSIGDITQTFIKFSAASKSSGISLELTNRLFSEVTRAAGVLGLSGESVTGMLEALGQMASKGVVSMEELRQQLGDRLPGALSLVANGLGLTESALIKLVENGGLTAVDLFQALTDELPKLKGEATGLAATWQRLTNAFSEAAVQGGDAGWLDVLTGGLKALIVVVGPLVTVFHLLAEGFFLVGKAAAIFLGPGLGDMDARLTLFSEEVDKMNGRLSKVTAAFDAASGAIDGTSGKTAAATSAMQQYGVAAAQASLVANKTALALEAQAFAADLAAKGTFSLSAQIIQFKAYVDTLLVSQQAQIEADAKLAKAAKIQGDSLAALTELRGQDYLSLQAQADATGKYAAAMDKAAQSQLAELELLTLKRDEIIKNAEARGLDQKAVQTQIDEIEKKIVTSKAETEQTQQASDAARQDANIRKLNAQAYKDNSDAVTEFKQAMDDAQAMVNILVMAQKDGAATAEMVEDANKRLTEATYLYNDAIKDSIAALELESRVRQANMNLAETKLQIEQRNYESLAQAARASGDYVMALYYEIEARRRQIQIIQLTSEAKKLEAEATLKALEIERSALDQMDPMLKQKQAEIDIRIANAKAKLLEAEAGADIVRALEREIQGLRDADAARNNETKGRDENTAAINRQTAALRDKMSAQYDEQNFALDMEGNRLNATGEPAPYKAPNGGWMYVDRTGQMRRSNKQPVKDPLGGYLDADLAQADQAMGKGEGQNAGRDAWEAAYGPNGTKLPAATAPAAGGTRNMSQTVNINIGGGRTRAVNVASGDDANALVGILRELETAAGAAG